MNTSLLVATAVVTTALTGCSLIQSPDGDRAEGFGQPDLVRYIEIEVDDPARGLPCSVVDRPDAETRDVLWRAEFEKGFCQRKAMETRLILENQGWACQPESADERRRVVHPTKAGRSSLSDVVAAWRCVEDLTPIRQLGTASPPVPVAKPDQPEISADRWGDEALHAAIEKDLAAIGQDVIGPSTRVDTALGDLDDDGIDDAIVILSRQADRGRPHRLLMAYLQSGETYNLVDVWILKTPDGRAAENINLVIEKGVILLEDCCETQRGLTTLVLENRKLAHTDGGAPQ